MRLVVGKALHCSRCYGQYPGRRYVDCDAAWDGPVVNQVASVMEPGVDPMAIDDLILCEDCIVEIAGLVGLSRDEEAQRKLTEQGAVIAGQDQQIAKLLNKIVKLEGALHELTPPKPKRTPEEQREFMLKNLEKARAVRAANRAAAKAKAG